MKIKSGRDDTRLSPLHSLFSLLSLSLSLSLSPPSLPLLPCRIKILPPHIHTPLPFRTTLMVRVRLIRSQCLFRSLAAEGELSVAVWWQRSRPLAMSRRYACSVVCGWLPVVIRSSRIHVYEQHPQIFTGYCACDRILVTNGWKFSQCLLDPCSYSEPLT